MQSLTLAFILLAINLINAIQVRATEGQLPLTVGVFYYPWHTNNFHGRKFVHEKLNPRSTLSWVTTMTET